HVSAVEESDLSACCRAGAAARRARAGAAVFPARRFDRRRGDAPQSPRAESPDAQLLRGARHPLHGYDRRARVARAPRRERVLPGRITPERAGACCCRRNACRVSATTWLMADG